MEEWQWRRISGGEEGKELLCVKNESQGLKLTLACLILYIWPPKIYKQNQTNVD